MVDTNTEECCLSDLRLSDVPCHLGTLVFLSTSVTVDWKEEMKSEMQKWFSATTGKERPKERKTVTNS
jgi:hypothetical protein